MILPGDIIYYLGPSRDKIHSIYLHILVIFSPSKIKDVVWEIMKSWYSFALSNSFWNCFETPRSKIPRLQTCPSLIAPIKHPMIQCSIPVLCPSILRLAKDKVMGVLDQASKARKISLELQNVEFASELSGQMKKHAEDMETTYVTLSKLTQGNSPEEKPLKKILAEIATKDQWFEKAEARQCLTSVLLTQRWPEAKLRDKRIWTDSTSMVCYNEVLIDSWGYPILCPLAMSSSLWALKHMIPQCLQYHLRVKGSFRYPALLPVEGICCRDFAEDESSYPKSKVQSESESSPSQRAILSVSMNAHGVRR